MGRTDQHQSPGAGPLAHFPSHEHIECFEVFRQPRKGEEQAAHGASPHDLIDPAVVLLHPSRCGPVWEERQIRIFVKVIEGVEVSVGIEDLSGHEAVELTLHDLAVVIGDQPVLQHRIASVIGHPLPRQSSQQQLRSAAGIHHASQAMIVWGRRSKPVAIELAAGRGLRGLRTRMRHTCRSCRRHDIGQNVPLRKTRGRFAVADGSPARCSCHRDGIAGGGRNGAVWRCGSCGRVGGPNKLRNTRRPSILLMRRVGGFRPATADPRGATVILRKEIRWPFTCAAGASP